MTRCRFEARGKTEQEVADALAEAARRTAELLGGSWHTPDDDPPQLQTTKNGYWGRTTIKRVVME